MDIAKSARTRLRTTATRLQSPELDEANAIQLLGGRTFQEALGDADAIVGRMAGLIAKTLVSERDATLPSTLDDPLPDVPGYAAVVVRLKNRREQLLRDITVTAEVLTPAGVADLLERRRARQQAVATWNEEFPKLVEALERERPDVQAFLRAAATPEGARLSLLTADVRSRLEEEQLLDEFRIHRR